MLEGMHCGVAMDPGGKVGDSVAICVPKGWRVVEGANRDDWVSTSMQTGSCPLAVQKTTPQQCYPTQGVLFRPHEACHDGNVGVAGLRTL